MRRQLPLSIFEARQKAFSTCSLFFALQLALFFRVKSHWWAIKITCSWSRRKSPLAALLFFCLHRLGHRNQKEIYDLWKQFKTIIDVIKPRGEKAKEGMRRTLRDIQIDLLFIAIRLPLLSLKLCCCCWSCLDVDDSSLIARVWPSDCITQDSTF